MSAPELESVARAILYEGYLLYPYRASSVKNRQRWTFGGLYPRDWSEAAGGLEPWQLQTEFLFSGEHWSRIKVRAHFLHLWVEEGTGWQEGEEREVVVPETLLSQLPASTQTEVSASTRQGAGRTMMQYPLRCAVEVSVDALGGGLHRLTARLKNETAAGSDQRARAEAQSLCSAHLLFEIEGGQFHSLIDPPHEQLAAAALCHNVGCWPVLAGPKGEQRAMLASPIILYDYPQIAPESAGDLFDGTEIDEILSLRIQTLTDAEKEEVRRTDPRAKALLDRTEGLSGEAMRQLHGAVRHLDRKPVRAPVPGGEVRPGDRVRLKPRPRGDVFDLALAGKIATVASVEQDFEGRLHLAVTVDDDPGQDLGNQGKPGHRFFFSPDEVELP
jgi:hypothetical protein